MELVYKINKFLNYNKYAIYYKIIDNDAHDNDS